MRPRRHQSRHRGRVCPTLCHSYGDRANALPPIAPSERGSACVQPTGHPPTALARRRSFQACRTAQATWPKRLDARTTEQPPRQSGNVAPGRRFPRLIGPNAAQCVAESRGAGNHRAARRGAMPQQPAVPLGRGPRYPNPHVRDHSDHPPYPPMDSAHHESVLHSGRPSKQMPRRCGKRSSAQCRRCRSCPRPLPSSLRSPGGLRRGPATRTRRHLRPEAQAHARDCSGLWRILDPAQRTLAGSRTRRPRSEQARAPTSDRRLRPCIHPPEESVSPRSRQADFSPVLRMPRRRLVPHRNLDPICPLRPAERLPYTSPVSTATATLSTRHFGLLVEPRSRTSLESPGDAWPR